MTAERAPLRQGPPVASGKETLLENSGFSSALQDSHSRAMTEISWEMSVSCARGARTTSTGRYGTTKHSRAALAHPRTASATRALALEPSAREAARCKPRRAGTRMKSKCRPRDVQTQPEPFLWPTSVRWSPVPGTTRAREAALGYYAATVQQTWPWNSMCACHVRAMLQLHRLRRLCSGSWHLLCFSWFSSSWDGELCTPKTLYTNPLTNCCTTCILR